MKALIALLLLAGTATAAPHDRIKWEPDANPQGQKYTWARYGHCSLQFTETGGVTRAQIEIIVDIDVSKDSFCMSAKGDVFKSAFVTVVDDTVVSLIPVADPDAIEEPEFVERAKKKANKLAKALGQPFAFAFRERGTQTILGKIESR